MKNLGVTLICRFEQFQVLKPKVVMIEQSFGTYTIVRGHFVTALYVFPHHAKFY